jgi:hypothetical protein
MVLVLSGSETTKRGERDVAAFLDVVGDDLVVGGGALHDAGTEDARDALKRLLRLSEAVVGDDLLNVRLEDGDNGVEGD